MSCISYHLPGLFEFFGLYKLFLPLFRSHREWFHEWCDIGSIYGAPSDCIWGGGRVGSGENHIEKDVLDLAKEYGFQVRLAFSNSMLREEHLSDRKCNSLCSLFHSNSNGIIVHSDLLLEYIRKNYPDFYLVSSTTKVITDFSDFKSEVDRPEFKYVVPDFRLNVEHEKLNKLSQQEKDKVEFLCNECCWFECPQRKKCYENVSCKVLGMDVPWKCASPDSSEGYVFSKAMKNMGFIGIENIKQIYMPMGFSNFKIEGRTLGSALVLEMLLYYMVKAEHQIEVREHIYLDNSLDLF